MKHKPLDMLIADDEETIRTYFVRVLNRLGHECDEAVDGKDCIKKCSQKKYDVVFLDLVMPLIDGNTVLKQIRKDSPELAIIFISVQDDEDAIREILDAGATAYLTKPISSDDIEGVVYTLQQEHKVG